MVRSHPYLVHDRDGFAYRRRVPDDVFPHVGKRIWKKRLKAKDVRSAERDVRQIAHEHDMLVAQVRGLPLPTKHQALTFVAAEAFTRLEYDPTAEKELAAASTAAAKIERAMIAAAEQRVDLLPAEERAAIEKVGGLEAFFRRVPRDVEWIEANKLSLGLRKVVGQDVEEEEAVQAVRTKRAAKNRQTLAKLDLLPGDIPEFDDPKNPRIKSVMEPWFATREQQEAAQKRHRVAINRFTSLHGNVPVRSITREMVEEYVATIKNLTDHRCIPTNQRGGLVNIDGLPKVSAKTVERHIISLKACLTFCVEKGWITVSPANGIRPPKDTRPKSAKRRAMTREERIQFLNRAIAEHGEDSDVVWLIKLSAYFGTRLEEVAQLPRSAVKVMDGIWCVDLSEGDHHKSDESARVTPLHPAICDDFIAWLEKTDTPDRDRLFMSFVKKGGRYSGKLSGDMGRLMDRADLSDSRLVMHSFRHGLTQALMSAGVDGDLRRLILGHRVKDAHGDYLYADPPTKLAGLRMVKSLF